MLLLVHHGDAVGSDVDTRRPLSARGRSAVDALARTAASKDLKPVAVWHSGKLRARETAEAFWRHCNALADFSAEPGLQPDDPPSVMRDRLSGETRDLVVVGHMPHLARLMRLMVAGDIDAALPFPPHGAVALEPAPGGQAQRWIERWRLDEPRGDDATETR